MGGMCSAQASSAPVYATDEAREPAREIQADQEVGATAAARAGEAAVRAGRGARHPSLDARLRTDPIFSTPSNPVQVEGEERT